MGYTEAFKEQMVKRMLGPPAWWHDGASVSSWALVAGSFRVLVTRAGRSQRRRPTSSNHVDAEEEIARMVKSIKIPRARLSAVDGLIRFHFPVSRGATTEFTELILKAERTGETLELLDPEGPTPLGLVTVFGQSATPLGNAGLDEWVVRLQAEDKKAQDTLAALPPGPPDPF